MKLESNLKQSEIVAILKTYSFEDLKVSSVKDRAYTYSYSKVSKAKLDKALGAHTVAGGGKVAVYQIPNVGKLGVSFSTDVVRFIDQTEDSGIHSNDTHLAYVKVSPALSKAFVQAAASPGLRVAYCKHLFEYLNTHKFHGALPTPRFEVSAKSPSIKNARGVFSGGAYFSPGTVWMASFMFDAREPFFLEVFLHELCHLANWCITKSEDRSERGHGPSWRSWMVKVGLDPRRFDPTDNVEYLTGPAKHAVEMQNNNKYGPRSSAAEIKSLEKVDRTVAGERYIIVAEGRIIRGILYPNKFVGKTSNGKELVWSKKPKDLTYYKYQ